jgi:hypothetical protein
MHNRNGAKQERSRVGTGVSPRETKAISPPHYLLNGGFRLDVATTPIRLKAGKTGRLGGIDLSPFFVFCPVSARWRSARNKSLTYGVSRERANLIYALSGGAVKRVLGNVRAVGRTRFLFGLVLLRST